MNEHQANPPITAATVRDKLDRFLGAVADLDEWHGGIALEAAQTTTEPAGSTNDVDTDTHDG